MREILFRAKRLDNGEWVEGVPFIAANCCKMIQAVAVHPDFVDEGNVYYSEGYPVDPNTVGQHTGLTDKNGRKIFEGDVCRFYGAEGYSDYVVFWDDTTSQWTVRQIDLGAKDVLDSYFAECCEVIGNIHDNPELLNQ
ncbi:MAG: hypothetical protein IJB11_06665 [Oscillospiraceae bacterium]|nr:hypothetical protein [Oscillospiraceae bacterium]